MSAITCYRCRRPGNIAADCRAQVVHDDETPAEVNGDSTILALTEKRNRKKKGSRDKDAAASDASDRERSWTTHADSCLRRATKHEPWTAPVASS
uniref:CCHC-type domain-containing protein n=1 Tax=Peronospora matthiolae TaxID=2874970 RepID=A0AAV1VLM9_9STRA